MILCSERRMIILANKEHFQLNDFVKSGNSRFYNLSAYLSRAIVPLKLEGKTSVTKQHSDAPYGRGVMASQHEAPSFSSHALQRISVPGCGVIKIPFSQSDFGWKCERVCLVRLLSSESLSLSLQIIGEQAGEILSDAIRLRLRPNGNTIVSIPFQPAHGLSVSHPKIIFRNSRDKSIQLQVGKIIDFGKSESFLKQSKIQLDHLSFGYANTCFLQKRFSEALTVYLALWTANQYHFYLANAAMCLEAQGLVSDGACLLEAMRTLADAGWQAGALHFT